MPLTLREAMALVEPLKKARIVAGERGLDRIIQAVNVMEVPDILEWVHPGELLVTTMYPLRDDAAASVRLGRPSLIEVLQPEHDARPVQDTHDHLLPVYGREDRHPEVDGFARGDHAKVPVLGHTPLRDVQVGNNLDA